MRILDILIS